VVEKAPFGGPLWVKIGGRRQAMGFELTEIVFGRPA